MRSAIIALAWVAALLPAGRVFAQPPGTLQGGTYNAPAGAGAYSPVSPSPFGMPAYGPAQTTFPGLPSSPRAILNHDILNPGGWSFAPVLPSRGQKRSQTPAGRGNESSAVITVMVPTPEAELWVNGKPTKQKGLRRVFVSPPLEPGTYRYVFRASWRAKGAPGGVEEPVTFQPGADLMIDLAAKR